MRTVVLVPCFNEAATIGAVVAAFRTEMPDAVVYVYDNNSTDGSGQIAGDAGAVVVREYRQGKGAVIRSMFRDIDADCYIMVDGDDTYPAEDAVALSRHVASGAADMVIGDRLSSTYFSENKRPLHGIGNRLVRFLVNHMFGSEIKDIMTGCRCFSRRFVKGFPVVSTGFEIETEMTLHALDKGFLIVEEPVGYRDRQPGSDSKLQTIPDGLRVLRTVFTLFRDYRPLQFFGLLALMLLLGSVASFIPPLNEYIETGYVRKVPTLIVSMGLGLGAMLSLMSGAILGSLRAQARQSYELLLTLIVSPDKRGGVGHDD